MKYYNMYRSKVIANMRYIGNVCILPRFQYMFFMVHVQYMYCIPE